MLISEGSKLLFIGDSITDFDRQRPVGEVPCGLGNGYIMLTAFSGEKDQGSQYRRQR